YLILSLDYRIDFSDLRPIAASKSVCNVFSFPCSYHHVTNRLGVTGRSACRCIILHPVHSRAPPGCARRAPRPGLQGSGGSARHCYVAGCALEARRRRRGFTDVLSLRSPSATATGFRFGNSAISRSVPPIAVT